MTIRVEWKPQDCWIGAFWKSGGSVKSYMAGTGEYRVSRRVDLWVCLVPMVPIHFTWFQAVVSPEGARP